MGPVRGIARGFYLALVASLVLLVLYMPAVFCQPPPGCFDPTKVTALTFYQNAMTTSARAPPIAQLSCVGGNGCKYASQISSVQCQNNGLDEYGNVQWQCTANLPSEVEFGSTTVSCEGCQSSTDGYKLTGSCGLMFQLDMVNTK
jgi:hypothetical protein